MKKSRAKRNPLFIHSSTDFTKKSKNVSGFSAFKGNSEPIDNVISELRELFSRLKRDGIERDKLELDVKPSDNKLFVLIYSKSEEHLTLSETNLIFRLAIELGLSPRVNENKIELAYTLPKIDSKLCARALALLRSELRG